MDSPATTPSRSATGYFFFSLLLATASSFLFQVAAGRALSDQDISSFTAWGLTANLWCVPAVAFQYFVSLSRRPMPLARPVLLGTAMALVGAVGALGSSFARVPSAAMIVLAFAALMVSALFVGRLQAEGRMVDLGHVNVIMAAARCGIPVLLGSSVAAWQVALPLSTLVAAIGAVGVFIVRTPGAAKRDAKGPEAGASFVRRLTGSVLLTSMAVVLPFLDFKLIEWTQDPAISGQFARASTLGRVLYFGGVMLLQVVYPLQLKAGRGEGSPALSRFLKHADWFVMACLVMGTIALAGGSRWLIPLLFGRVSELATLDVLVSCFNFSLLVLVLGHMQARVTKLALAQPLLLAAWLGVSVAGLVWFGRGARPLNVLAGASLSYLAATAFVLRARRHDPRDTTCAAP